jgi:acyl dehydratase
MDADIRAVMPERNDFRVGEEATFTRTVTQSDVEAFAALTGDSNPVHLDEQYALSTPFNGRIAHGMLVAGFISRVLGTQLPGPGAIYVSQQMKFTTPVYPGDTITVRVQVTAWDDVRGRITLLTEVTNHKGATVVTGEAQLAMSAYMKSR